MIIQIAIKIVIILAIFLIAFLTSTKVWKTEIDFKGTLKSQIAGKTELPFGLVAKDQNGLYKNGEIYAQVVNATLDSDKNQFHFDEVIYLSKQNDNVVNLDIFYGQFEFRHQIVEIGDSDIGGLQTFGGYKANNVIAKIIK